ncbi:hypothetical protein MVLG_03947 [Microbotryum lychnidis-dioicae p1A1 Lamole]|uniref:tRNA-splicing endonuclease subunit Sen15 domain-containing protein n=1 Tax=Microbotryum lychnidis-dioicae (strain p1A1 Lamole / MvSl-1064) TaxID=683840 RepID=U5H9Q8_USTV1|nr:hypothetical protein MVLG_03947 [Microbotryum lychnidis-dioicae p1A1 Lamole]|eukprot:KDE05713.1 hypothetical protein MVLG_03947 [Microbotryum lychnidis-dioicae p1A1 Lamole]
MSHLHPLAGPLLPYLQKYPSQASSLFQAYQDLYLAQTWQGLEVVDLPSCECVVIKGRPQNKTVPSFALPINLSTATSLRSLSNVFEALDKLPSEKNSSATDTQTESPTIYLAIAERDSSIVYYVLRHGIVSPKEVPE